MAPFKIFARKKIKILKMTIALIYFSGLELVQLKNISPSGNSLGKQTLRQPSTSGRPLESQSSPIQHMQILHRTFAT